MEGTQKYKVMRRNEEIEFYGKFLKEFTNEHQEKDMKYDMWDNDKLYELYQTMNKGNSLFKYLISEEHHEIENGVETVKYSIMVWDNKEKFLKDFMFLYMDGPDNKIYQELKKYFEVK